MNLHGIVAGVIGSVNPFVAATMKISSGYTTNPDGSRVPTYDTASGRAQVQALTFKDLSQMDGVNKNGAARGIYLDGDFSGVLRTRQKGGDIITLADGPNAGDWLITQVLETWPNWCKVAAVLQNP